MPINLKIDYLEPTDDNLALEIEANELHRLGASLHESIKADIQSREPYITANMRWLRLAAQIVEKKNTPWANASNVKYPLLTLAAIQFHARAMPNLVNSGMPVKSRVMGRDDSGEKRKRANRIQTFMSYQVMEQQENWLDDTDRLLYILPISGQAHRKVYRSEIDNQNASSLVLAHELAINYHAKDLKKARKTHIKDVDQNEMYELVAADVLIKPKQTPEFKADDDTTDAMARKEPTFTDAEDQPYQIYECHCMLDLDDDGYKEPYIVTMHADDGQILRIQTRWEATGVKYNETSGELIKITPREYFASYMFLPDPHSATHGMGFGSLLGPLNESANTIINQLIDAGTLANRQVGFIARGVKLGAGKVQFQPGEWKYINSNSEDLRKGIFPLPTKEPSTVLFSLLGMIIESGERIASISDMMVGESPGQNQPASTTMAVLEQGLKVFTGIFQRIFRSMGREFKILFSLNRTYPPTEDVYKLLDDGTPLEILAQDFEEDKVDVIPAADPNIVTDAQKSLKAQGLMEKLANGLPINPFLATKMTLEAEGYENIEELMKVDPPQPDPEVMLKAKEQDHKEKIEWAQWELDAVRIQFEGLKDQADAMKKVAEAEQIEAGAQFEQYMKYMEQLEGQKEQVYNRLQQLSEIRKNHSQAQQMDETPRQSPAAAGGGDA